MATATKSSTRAPRQVRRFKIKRETIANQQAELLLRIRAQEGLSRVDLARSLNLAPSTVGIYVDHLVEEGYLFEGRAAERDFGRPPTILALNPRGGRFIGVDFEARNIMATAVDFSQRPLKQFHDTIAVAEPVEKILEKIEHAIETVSVDDDREVLAIGVGAMGIGGLTALGLAHLKVKALPLFAVAGGGLLFGAGFAVAGYCPGTCLVGAAEGRRDAIFTVLGGLFGALAYALAHPLAKRWLLDPVDLGKPTLASVTGVALP